jgi:hypothetical protein
MVRGFALFASTLTAVSAQAQDARTSTGAAKEEVVVSASREGHAIMLASRSTPEPNLSAPGRSMRSGSSDGGADAGTLTKESASSRIADCSFVETYLGGDAPAVRTYAVPLAVPTGPAGGAWKQAPYVRSVARCGQLYIFQVWSRSTEPWAIKNARLEGPRGETFQVNALRFNGVDDGWDINVIVAEAPQGAKPSELKLHMTGKDDRVAQPEVRDLP